MIFSGTTGSTHGMTLNTTPTTNAATNASRYALLPSSRPKIFVDPLGRAGDGAAAPSLFPDSFLSPGSAALAFPASLNSSGSFGFTSVPTGTTDVLISTFGFSGG